MTKKPLQFTHTLKTVKGTKCNKHVYPGTRLTSEEFYERTKAMNITAKNFSSMSNYVKIQHNDCGHSFEIKPASKLFKDNYKCSVCVKQEKIKINEEKFINKLKEKNLDFEYVSGYINSMEETVILKHTKCNTQLLVPISPRMLFVNGPRRFENMCPTCSKDE